MPLDIEKVRRDFETYIDSEECGILSDFALHESGLFYLNPMIQGAWVAWVEMSKKFFCEIVKHSEIIGHLIPVAPGGNIHVGIRIDGQGYAFVPSKEVGTDWKPAAIPLYTKAIAAISPEPAGYGVFWVEKGTKCSKLCSGEAEALEWAARNLSDIGGSVEPIYRSGAVPENVRQAAEFTRADLGDAGTNYPHVRALLAYVESHIKAKEK